MQKLFSSNAGGINYTYHVRPLYKYDLTEEDYASCSENTNFGIQKVLNFALVQTLTGTVVSSLRQWYQSVVIRAMVH